MKVVKVARMPYIRARQSELLAFGCFVHRCMTTGAPYQSLQSLVEALNGALQEYGATLVAARNKGVLELAAKSAAREAVIFALHNIASALNILAAGREQIIRGAGFSLQEYTGKRYHGPLPTPEILSVHSIGIRGELCMALRDAMPRSVETHVIEFSFDQGQTWDKRMYHTGRRFTVKGLPRIEALWVRVKSVGRGKRISEWSEVVVVAVH